MSVLIKGMDMPDKCGHCRFATAFECEVTKNFITTFNIRQFDCPLVSVPEHGRLIDADALEELFREVIGNIAKRPEIGEDLEHMVRASAMVVQMIQDAPTIIPAEPPKEEEENGDSD